MYHKILTLKHDGACIRVPVSFDTNRAEEFNSRMAEVVRQERALKATPTDAVAALYGQAITRLYKLVFGIAQTAAVLGFYGDDTLAMVTAINPVIVSEIMPAVRRTSARNMAKARRAFVKGQREAARR